jgi:hypothetical protein
MIKNIIIIALVIFVITKLNVTPNDMLDWVQSMLDKIQELVYIMKEKV